MQSVSWVLVGVGLLLSVPVLAEEPAPPAVTKKVQKPDQTSRKSESVKGQKQVQRSKGSSTSPSDVLGPGGIGTGLNNALGGINSGAALSGEDGGLGGGLSLSSRPAPRIVFKPASITTQGGLSDDVVQRLVRRHWNEVRYCYEKELAQNPRLEGKLQFSWNINEEGNTQDVTLRSSTLRNTNTEACIQQSARRWVFPANKPATAVDWALELKTE